MTERFYITYFRMKSFLGWHFEKFTDYSACCLRTDEIFSHMDVLIVKLNLRLRLDFANLSGLSSHQVL